MIAGLALGSFAALGAATIFAIARRDHRTALGQRARLLDPAAALFAEARVRAAADGFPILTGRLADRRPVTVELIPDTLVTRRLPQLWMIVTLDETTRRARPSFGALARPTGAEFYSHVDALPERMEPPPGLEGSIMIRGNAPFGAAHRARAGAALRHIFADPGVKEIVVTPAGVRIVRQASQGERGAHLLLRQACFAIDGIDPALVETAIAEADAMREALDWTAGLPATLSA